MARFNSPSRSRVRKTVNPTTVNYAGGLAYQKTPKTELVGRLLAHFLQTTFYMTAKEQTKGLAEVVHKVGDPLFCAKAAVYARDQFGMRSTSHVVAAEVAALIREGYKQLGVNFSKPWFKRFFDRIVVRPDDMIEILALFLKEHGKPIPNSLKKGFASAFGRFDKYQLAKYRAEGKELTLAKVAKLVWPNVTDKNREALALLWTNSLVSTGTWETKLTKAGEADNVQEAKQEAWDELVLTGKIGQFALLRNLRNIVQTCKLPTVEQAAKLLTNLERITGSRILPFRYWTAYEELSKLVQNAEIRLLLKALEEATDLSMACVPKLPGRTLVALDGSGSMQGKPWNIGSMFAAALYRSRNAVDFVLFSGDAREFSSNQTSVFGLMKELTKKAQFGGTNYHAVFQWAVNQKQRYDRIVILSDGEAWMGHVQADKSLQAYENFTGARPAVYFFDFQGGHSLQFKENRIFYIPGFSEKVFELMALMETGMDNIAQAIEAVEI